ncbi:hypothetical protein [Halotia branconii]|uniref:Uncharacterized protein n=1 Tax=Halotia branconii CENA392 TaxID=1539056 RepID=A0AAJ6NT49_9CYAN|nr:hypothetical protein [Halotia branconii]WGV23476.1 hypothetical protein QI031_16760 [Halotia branconii CENA392]WGV25665.1 hypothetical protein QI031_28760 [Halotia branconii CENA392]WGV25923.1 hypothetical protein QI031_30165 [Halotia branconii CENA392]
MNQKTLDRFSTVLGLVAGVSSVLGGSGMIGSNTATIITGISTAILGYLVQRPASDKPAD